MEQEPLITVVVPIYNVEKYLGQCLDSLLFQTVCNHKVILINDGSKDRSGEIAMGYAAKRPDLFVYHEQENAGLGAARNAGMGMVQTKYTMFLDSDDWLVPRFIERITRRLEREREDPDLIFTLPHVFNMASRCFERWADAPLFEQLFASDGAVINPKEDARIYGLEVSANRRVYRTQFLRMQGFRFPTGTKWEDVEPHFRLLHAANRCIGEGSVGFCYRINSGGQITASAGTDRLQVVSVFSRALANAYQNEWSRIEVSHILRTLLVFSKWSISMSSLPVRKELVRRLHGLYHVLPKNSLKSFYRDFEASRKDRAFIKVLRSPLYWIIGIPAYCNRVYGKAARLIEIDKTGKR